MLIEFVTALCAINVWETEREDCIEPEPVKRQSFKPLSAAAIAQGKRPFTGTIKKT